jgi:hypothetical protein
MTGFVSNRSIWTGASLAAMSILWVVFVLPATGIVADGLPGLSTLAAAFLVATLAVSHVIHDAERPRVRATLPGVDTDPRRLRGIGSRS